MCPLLHDSSYTPILYMDPTYRVLKWLACMCILTTIFTTIAELFKPFLETV